MSPFLHKSWSIMVLIGFNYKDKDTNQIKYWKYIKTNTYF